MTRPETNKKVGNRNEETFSFIRNLSTTTTFDCFQQKVLFIVKNLFSPFWGNPKKLDNSELRMEPMLGN